MSHTITRNDLARMYPRAPGAWLDAFVKLCPVLFPFYGVTRLRWVHLAGQMAAETDSLTLNPMREDMRYSATRMLQVYAYRLNLFITENQKRNPPTLIGGRMFTNAAALAAAIQYQPETIADIVYGNREGTPWMQGHLYIGRGPTQTTHLNGYREIGAEIARQPGGAAYDLVASPDILATDPEVGVRAAFANFQKESLWMWCDRDDCDTLSDALNTGNIHDNIKPLGLPRRQTETARAKAIWPADSWTDDAIAAAPAPLPALAPIADVSPVVAEDVPAAARDLTLGDQGDDVRRLQQRLSDLQFGVGQVDGVFGKLTRRALVAFQAEHDLVADGVAGSRTREVLAQAGVPDLGARQAITAADLKAAGSQTIATTSFYRKVMLAVKGGSGLEFADQYFDLGVLDSAVSKGEQLKSILTRGHALASDAIPVTAGAHGLVMAFCVVTALVAFAGYVALGKVQKRRVADAQNAANLH